MPEANTDVCMAGQRGNRPKRLLMWGVPIGLFIVHTQMPGPAGALLLTLGFLWLGTASTINAIACRRVHCTVLGPIFLLLGLASAGSQFGIVTVPNSWVGPILTGGFVLGFVPEMFGIRYWTKNSIDAVVAAVRDDRPDLRSHAAQDGTMTLMFSDVVGFTPMTERLGDRRAHAVMQKHHAIVRGQVAAHRGIEVELQGDGFLLAFANPQKALHCAVAIQQDFAAYNADHPREPVRLRMGLHTGEVIRDGQKYFGKTVIVTSRIADQAQGEQILVSEALKQLVQDGDAVRFGPSRDLTLKGLSHPYSVYELEWPAVSDPASAIMQRPVVRTSPA